MKPIALEGSSLHNGKLTNEKSITKKVLRTNDRIYRVSLPHRKSYKFKSAKLRRRSSSQNLTHARTKMWCSCLHSPTMDEIHAIAMY